MFARENLHVDNLSTSFKVIPRLVLDLESELVPHVDEVLFKSAVDRRGKLSSEERFNVQSRRRPPCRTYLICARRGNYEVEP